MKVYIASHWEGDGDHISAVFSTEGLARQFCASRAVPSDTIIVRELLTELPRYIVENDLDEAIEAWIARPEEIHLPKEFLG